MLNVIHFVLLYYRVWSQLNDKAESARFFFQWNSSFLKDRFYTAVKVDPMVTFKTHFSTLPLFVQ